MAIEQLPMQMPPAGEGRELLTVWIGSLPARNAIRSREGMLVTQGIHGGNKKNEHRSYRLIAHVYKKACSICSSKRGIQTEGCMFGIYLFFALLKPY